MLKPLIQGKGGIGLFAVVEFITRVKPVLEALEYVKKGAQWLSENTPVNIDAELYFNLYTKDRVDLQRTIDFYQFRNTKTDVKISLLFGIELDLR